MASGAETSFEDLVAEHQHAVLRVCRSILRDEHLGADAAQETFVRLWRSVSANHVPDSIGAWIRRVAVTTSLDHLKSRDRRARRHERVGRESAAATNTSPTTELEARELQERFERALEKLSDGQRTVFLLRHSAGMPLSQVAELLGVALPTVKTQFARACLRLQSALRHFEPENDA